jgi:hypothetical protein
MTTTKKKTVKHAVNSTPVALAPLTAPKAAGAPGGPPPAPAPNLSGVPGQIQAIEAQCGYETALTAAERKTSVKVVERVPDTIIARVLTFATREHGVIAGVAIDPDVAKKALADADQADAIADAADALSKVARDQAIRLRANVAGNVSAIVSTMRGYARTPQGAALKPEVDELRALAKQAAAARKARKTKATKAASANAATPAAPPSPTPSPAPHGT